jgi:hypothetical protein
MVSDRRVPLGPVSPELQKALGPLQSLFVEIRGGMDIYADVWFLGEGTSGSPQRGTTVKVWLTPSGTLITNVTVWRREPGKEEYRSTQSRGAYHETPQGALDWLEKDGEGTFGPASKLAWRQACTTFAPMNGMDRNHVA